MKTILMSIRPQHACNIMNGIKTIETLEKLDEFNKKIVRHEIVHAFFHESGLTKYENDEVLVDWLALQFGKIDKVFVELGIKEE